MNSKITELDLVSVVDQNDLLPIVNDGITKKVKVSQLEQYLVNPTILIFNDPISTTNTNAVLARSVNIGALNNYKKIIIDTETHSDNTNAYQKVKLILKNIVDNSEIELISFGNGIANNTIFKSFYINNNNIIMDNQYSDNYTSNFNGQPAYLYNFTPNDDYVVEIYINAQSTETITNRGLTIQLFR